VCVCVCVRARVCVRVRVCARARARVCGDVLPLSQVNLLCGILLN